MATAHSLVQRDTLEMSNRESEQVQPDFTDHRGWLAIAGMREHQDGSAGRNGNSN